MVEKGIACDLLELFNEECDDSDGIEILGLLTVLVTISTNSPCDVRLVYADLSSISQSLSNRTIEEPVADCWLSVLFTSPLDL